MNPARLAHARERARRATAERNSSATWAVTRPTPGGTTDDDGNWTPNTTPVWTGHGHMHSGGRPTLQRRRDTAITVEVPTLCVTGCTVRLRVGDIVTAVRSADPTLLGRHWRITGEPGSSHGIHRHYPLEEVTDGLDVR